MDTGVVTLNGDDAFNVHRLVQSVTRYHLEHPYPGPPPRLHRFAGPETPNHREWACYLARQTPGIAGRAARS
ncbi:MAG: hypothetical protein AAFO29_16035, partial [Actinomycetota bacterium]